MHLTADGRRFGHRVFRLVEVARGGDTGGDMMAGMPRKALSSPRAAFGARRRPGPSVGPSRAQRRSCGACPGSPGDLPSPVMTVAGPCGHLSVQHLCNTKGCKPWDVLHKMGMVRFVTPGKGRFSEIPTRRDVEWHSRGYGFDPRRLHL